MDIDFLYKIDSSVICDFCDNYTNMGISSDKHNGLDICYSCLSKLYREVYKRADYYEFKANQFHLNNGDKSTKVYFI